MHRALFRVVVHGPEVSRLIWTGEVKRFEGELVELSSGESMRTCQGLYGWWHRKGEMKSLVFLGNITMCQLYSRSVRLVYTLGLMASCSGEEKGDATSNWSWWNLSSDRGDVIGYQSVFCHTKLMLLALTITGARPTGSNLFASWRDSVSVSSYRERK